MFFFLDLKQPLSLTIRKSIVINLVLVKYLAKINILLMPAYILLKIRCSQILFIPNIFIYAYCVLLCLSVYIHALVYKCTYICYVILILKIILAVIEVF